MIAKDTHKSVILVWGFIWMIQAVIFFALGVIVGLVSFKVGLIIFHGMFSLKKLMVHFSRNLQPNRKNRQATSCQFLEALLALRAFYLV